MNNRTYAVIKQELEDILDWFAGNNVDIDEALLKHEQAEKLIAELEGYLKSATKPPKKS